MKLSTKLFQLFFIVLTLCIITSCIPNSKVNDEIIDTLTGLENESNLKYEISYKNVASWINSIGTMRIQVIAEISNTGTIPIYLSTSSYDLEDSNGQIIASKQNISTYPSVIKPGEKGYLYDETSLDNVVTGLITVVPRINAKKATVPCIRYEASEITISDTAYFGPKMVGRITNSTNEDEDGIIYVVAILYNNNNVPIGVLTDMLYDDFPKGTKMGFEATTLSLPDYVTASSIGNYTIYAYPSQYQF